MIETMSEMGTYHCENGGENQDVLCHAQNKRYSVISLADGVSSCPEARKGAQIACGAITNLFLKKADYFLELDKERVAEFVLSHILFELRRQAEADSRDLVDYSSTIAGVLVDKKRERMLCFNLGDSIIMAAGMGSCRVLSMPADSLSGCCATTTRGAASMISIEMLNTEGADSVIICSDGAWRQMFARNKLRPEVFGMLSNGEYDRLREFLTEQRGFDDSSFISLGLRPHRTAAVTYPAC